MDILKPAFNKNNVPICMFSSNEYAPYCGVAIKSIIENISDSNNYDIIVLERNIDKLNKHYIREIKQDKKNVSIRLIDISNYINLITVNTHSHFVIEGCFRLFLFSDIFIKYDKIISLDSDLIVEHDISELFNIDLGSNYMGASLDIIMEYLIAINGKSEGDTGNIIAKDYINKYLNIGRGDNEYPSYFNTGVAIFNLSKARQDSKFVELIRTINLKNYWFLEQDVLNIVFAQNILVIDGRWNALTGDIVKNKIIKTLSNEIVRKFKYYLENYYIIHYAGYNKPWIDIKQKNADVFFRYLKLTPWNDEILKKSRKNYFKYRTKKILKDSFLGTILDKIFPKGSKIRLFIKERL